MEPNIYYRVYNSLPLVSVLSQIHPVQALPSYFCNVYLNIIFPPTPWFTKWAAHVTIIYLVPVTIAWDKQKHGVCCQYVPRLLVLGFMFVLQWCDTAAVLQREARHVALHFGCFKPLNGESVHNQRQTLLASRARAREDWTRLKTLVSSCTPNETLRPDSHVPFQAPASSGS
jgi:hypothetical protein